MSAIRRRGVQIVAALSVVGVATSSCARPAATPPTTTTATTSTISTTSAVTRPEMVLTFDDSPARGLTIIAPRDTGAIPSRALVRVRDGGRVVAAYGINGAGARFPSVSTGPKPPMAAVVVVPKSRADGQGDVLSPGRRDFSFGADVVLNRVSEGPLDNGDNVMQRGLYADPSQLKLQLDHGTPSCRVAGAGGVAEVKARLVVERSRWYRLTCTRRGNKLTLDVRARTGSSWATHAQWSTSAITGSVSFDRMVLLSVGAKVGRDGQIPASSGDQLNGAVDNVFLELGGLP